MKKYNTIIIVAGASIKNKSFHRRLCKKADLLICADGGANNAIALGLIPDYVIGDMDSIKPAVFARLKKNGHTSIIENPDPNKTDLELAISLAETFQPIEIIIFGAIGDRMDHTLANILCLDKIKRSIEVRIIDDKNEIFLVDKINEIIGDKNDIISVVPLTDTKGLTCKGLKWPLNNKNTDFGWFGVRNRLIGKKAQIRLKKGKVLVIKSKE